MPFAFWISRGCGASRLPSRVIMPDERDVIIPLYFHSMKVC